MCKKCYVFDHVDTTTGEIVKGIAERVSNPDIEVPANKKNYKPLDHYVINVPNELVKEKVNNKVYLSDILLDLGDNCIFEKQLTGCGGTTLALEDKRNCIIAMPIIGSVESKEYVRDPTTHQITYISRPGTLCIYSGHNDSYETLRAYINEHTKTGEPIKIVCTYYQIPKLMNRLRGLNDDGSESDSNGKAMCVNWPDWFFYIDEMQAVLRYYGMNFKNESRKDRIRRKQDIRTMLRYIHYFKHVVFITATPLKEKYFFQEIFDADVQEPQRGNEPLKQLKRFKVVNMKFPEECVANYRVHRHQRKRVSAAAARFLVPFLQNKDYQANAHVFINSIDGILEIVRLLNICKYGDKIRIVCGKNEDNQEQIKESIKTMIENIQRKDGSSLSFEEYVSLNPCKSIWEHPTESINSDPKKVNFYTSTAFEGADIFDRNGKTIVVSYGFRTNTMYDISTLFKQIAGRIRDTSFFDIEFFFDGIRYEKDPKSGTSVFDRGLDSGNGEYMSAKEFRERIFNQDEKFALTVFRAMRSEELNNIYVSEGEEGFYYDIMLEDTDLHNNDTWNDFKILSNRVIDPNLNPFLKSGMDFVDELSDDLKDLVQELAMFPDKRYKTKDLLEVYKYLQKKESFGVGLNTDEAAAITIIETKYRSLVLAKETIGEKKMQELNFKKTDIDAEVRKEIVRNESESDKAAQIKKYLSKWIPVGDFITAKEKKRIAQEASKMFNVKIKVEDFFDVVLKTTRDKRFCKEGETKKIPFVVGWKHTLFD